MKIAFLTAEFPHPKMNAFGGIGTSISNLSKGLVESGHAVSVLVYGQNKDDFFEENGVSFYLIKNVKVKGISKWLTQHKIERLINKLYNEKKIDILEAPDWDGITSGIQPKCPIVVKLHGSDTYFCHLENRPVKIRNRYHESKALQLADGLLSVSRYTAEITKQLFALQRDITVIPNCIDLTKFDADDRNTSEQPDTILYFGTLVRKKGSLELPYIFNEVYRQNNQAKLILVGRDAQDVISGNGSVWEMMQLLFDKDALQNVTYVGSVTYDSIKEYINSATVCVFPTFAEALPVSWIEAMAMNKAIVASDIGWATEIIDHGVNGYLVNPKNHKEYADKISTLLNNSSLRKELGAAARTKAIQKFSIEVVAAQSVAYYQKIAENK
ncbi:glycosyltransferase family 1 protein [Flavobacterium silvisoli]|uniref:Glycosyltransferase family 1 protein n=1 Tax=Flavobacterium silvisoli TaxID=2529433 RepID=A0A4Q9YZ63_9FLAO|nr:glycosyltransferase family 4 protein [Flavobacterium silvisoli]TBX69244.1 glycosyltransferase family 1 protein [Flavobacterium silvisoli]